VFSYAVYGLVLVLILRMLPQGLVPAVRSRLFVGRTVPAVEAS
jgi:ABC-type branched-subunit amino acid transport system permease subunit